MAELVNLRRARKVRDRATRDADAAANRLHHGTAKVARDADRAGRALADRRLDGHRREDPSADRDG